MRPIDKEALDKLQAAYGPKLQQISAEFDGDEYTIIVKRPRRAEYKAFRSDLNDADKKPVAIENLLLSLLVYPSREEFNEILDEFPAASEVLGNQVAMLCGANVEAISKKAGN